MLIAGLPAVRKRAIHGQSAVKAGLQESQRALEQLRRRRDHVKSGSQIRRHFKNPWLIVFLRLGIIKLPCFLRRTTKGSPR
jgi:hypothetical protein